MVVECGLPKSLGNDTVDVLAKQAAAGAASPSVRALENVTVLGCSSDLVMFIDTDGAAVVNLARSFLLAWSCGPQRAPAAAGHLVPH